MEKPEKLPFDEQVERAVLGAILKNNKALTDIAMLLKKEAFHVMKHRHIYQAMLSHMQHSKSIDEVTIANILEKKKILNECGGMLYLTELLEAAPAPENVSYYANILKEHYLSREVIRISSEISRNIQSTDKNIDEVLLKAQEQIEEISRQKTEKSYHLLSEVTQTAQTEIEKLATQKAGLTGVSSGFRFLDQITTGLQASDLIVIAARPSAGKTAFSLNIAYNVAVKERKGVIFFSLEMSKEQIAKRVLSAYAEIDNKKIRTGKMEKEEWKKLKQEIETINSIPFYICDKPGLNSLEIHALSKQIHHELQGNLGLIVVDYMQLISAIGRYSNRQEEIAEVSRNLKLIAKELNVPVIANAQLNRDLEKRKDRRPILSDLRDSGTIEQDADIVMFIYRDVLYNKDTKDPNISEILVSKYRNGETGIYRLFFKGEFTRFFNLSLEQEKQYEYEAMTQEDSPI